MSDATATPTAETQIQKAAPQTIHLERNDSYFSMEKYAYMQQFAETMVKSNAVAAQFKNGSQIVAALQYGIELGYKPMEALQCICIVNGRFGIYAQEGIARFKRAGWDVTWVKSDDKVCTVKIKKGKDSFEETYSIEEAVTAGLTSKDPWKKYPKLMLRYRAMSMHRKFNVPEIMGAVRTSDELEDYPEFTPSATVSDLSADGFKPVPKTEEVKAEEVEVVDTKEKLAKEYADDEIAAEAAKKKADAIDAASRKKKKEKAAALKKLEEEEEALKKKREALKDEVVEGEKTLTEAMDEVGEDAKKGKEMSKEKLKSLFEKKEEKPAEAPEGTAKKETEKEALIRKIEEAAGILQFKFDPKDDDWATIVKGSTGREAEEIESFTKKELEELYEILASNIDA